MVSPFISRYVSFDLPESGANILGSHSFARKNCVMYLFVVVIAIVIFAIVVIVNCHCHCHHHFVITTALVTAKPVTLSPI